MRPAGPAGVAVAGRGTIGCVMTTLADRPGTALLVIDAQNGVVAHAHDRDRVVANIAALVSRARDAGTPVVWVQHQNDRLIADSEPWRIVAELRPADGESRIDKRYADAFEDTALESTLGGLAVGRLVVAGAQTDECIRSTLHGALARGYDAILVADAHTTDDLSEYGVPTPDLVIAHTNMYWSGQEAPGRTAGTIAAADVDFAAGV